MRKISRDMLKYCPCCGKKLRSGEKRDDEYDDTWEDDEFEDDEETELEDEGKGIEIRKFSFEGSGMHVMTDGEWLWWEIFDLCGVLRIRLPAEVRSHIDVNSEDWFNSKEPELLFLREPLVYKLLQSVETSRLSRFLSWMVNDVWPVMRELKVQLA